MQLLRTVFVIVCTQVTSSISATLYTDVTAVSTAADNKADNLFSATSNKALGANDACPLYWHQCAGYNACCDDTKYCVTDGVQIGCCPNGQYCDRIVPGY